MRQKGQRFIGGGGGFDGGGFDGGGVRLPGFLVALIGIFIR
jgi:hypothetical protein